MKLPGMPKFNSQIVLRILFVTLILSIFFPIRHVFMLPGSFITGAYSDFTSFSIYSCDLIIIALFLYSLASKAHFLKPNKLIFAWIIWLVFVFLLGFKAQINLNWYFLARIAELIVLHQTLRIKAYDYKSLMIKVFVLAGGFESIIAIFQFIYQKSLGLYILGEQHISIDTNGVAKIGLGMLRFIRGYGTFPHSNLLSAFLLTAIFFNLYLILQTASKKARIWLHFNLVLTIFGLFISFSRASILAMLVVLALFFIISLIKQGFNKKIALPAIVIVLTIICSTLVLKPFLLARSDLLYDQSAKERVFYAKIGLQIVSNNPIRGIGIGTSVLHMKQYSPVPLQPWEIQPIHNYYLLSAAEFGIVGALILLFLFLLYIKELITLIKIHFSFYHLTLLGILVAYLILMMFDHYFYTIEQTQLLLWLILGLIAAEIYEKTKKLPS